MEVLVIFISALFVNNVIFARFLGICPYMGVSQRTSTAVGMGLAVIFVMALASSITFLLQAYVLVPLNLPFLRTVTFILVIASLVQLVEIVLKKTAPSLYQALGIFLPLITTNCAILGIAILGMQKEYSFLNNLIFAVGSALGFALALIIFAGIRERLEFSRIPAPLKGMPIALVVASILALGFMGFAGLVK